jgi:lysophospholipase L1-like esterase
VLHRLGGYPLLLEKAVRQQGVTTPIAVRACEGATVADLLYGNPKLSPDCKAVDVVLQETRPTIALILIGINDLKGTAKNKQFMASHCCSSDVPRT